MAPAIFMLLSFLLLASQLQSTSVYQAGRYFAVSMNAFLPFLSQIPTGSLCGNNLIYANYINKNAPQDAFYFVPAYFDGTLKQALESAAPTRNAFAVFTACNNLFYLTTGLSNHLHNHPIHRRAGQQLSLRFLQVQKIGNQKSFLLPCLCKNQNKMHLFGCFTFRRSACYFHLSRKKKTKSESESRVLTRMSRGEK